MSDSADRASAWPKSDIEDWRRLVGEALGDAELSTLNTRRRDGIVVEPLYAPRRDVWPIAGRGAKPWTVVEIVDAADPDDANALALAGLEGGATGLSLSFAGALSAAGPGLPSEAGALRITLEGVDLAAIHLRLEPHAEGLAAAGWLQEIVDKAGIAPELTDIAFGLDPFAPFLQDGDEKADALVARFGALSAAGYRGPLATLDGRPYHEAGATEAQEIAAVLAAGAWWLRTLDRAGISPAACLAALGASLALDCEELAGIAKLRALRLTWARLQELCGAPPEPLRIHAETGRRMLTRADPDTNLLRTTLAAFAAAAGGADSIAVLPHTAALGHADRNARAIARNIQHLLMEEAHLHRVADPGAGSGAIEALTDQFAGHAWAEFQAIEREGGLIASLHACALQGRIAEARATLQKQVADGERPLVGATVYPAPGEVAAEALPAPDALAERNLAPVRLEQLAEAAT